MNNPTSPRSEVEDAVVRSLRSIGYEAEHGVSRNPDYDGGRYFQVDVVVGTVRIEVKSSSYNAKNHNYRFSITPKQRTLGFNADLIVLAPMDEYGIPIMYSVFPATYPKFYMPDGKIASAIYWKPQYKYKRTVRSSRNLTTTEMKDYKDCWDQIDRVRDLNIRRLLNDIRLPRRVNKAEAIIPELYVVS